MHAIRKGQVRWVAKGDAVEQRQFIHTIFGHRRVASTDRARHRTLRPRYLQHIPTTGDPLRYSSLPRRCRTARSYELDGQQYIIVDTGNMLWSFAIKK